MNNLDATIRFVFFYNTMLSFDELLSFTCAVLKISTDQPGRLQQIQALNRFLVEQLQQGGTAVLLIDEVDKADIFFPMGGGVGTVTVLLCHQTITAPAMSSRPIMS